MFRLNHAHTNTQHNTNEVDHIGYYTMARPLLRLSRCSLALIRSVAIEFERMSVPPPAPTTDMFRAASLAGDCGSPPTSTTSRSAPPLSTPLDGEPGSRLIGDAAMATRIVAGGETDKFCGDAIVLVWAPPGWPGLPELGGERGMWERI